MPTSVGSSKKQEFQKNIYFCFIDYAKDFVDQKKNCEKFLKRIGEFKMEIGNSRPPYLGLPGIPRGIPAYLTCLLRNLCGSRSNS